MRLHAACAALLLTAVVTLFTHHWSRGQWDMYYFGLLATIFGVCASFAGIGFNFNNGKGGWFVGWLLVFLYLGLQYARYGMPVSH